MQFSFSHEIVLEERGSFIQLSHNQTIPPLAKCGPGLTLNGLIEIFFDVTANICGSQNLIDILQQDLHQNWRSGSLGDAATSADDFSVL